eukprot:6226422-Lingulodinium_polyedra.AAC.1
MTPQQQQQQQQQRHPTAAAAAGAQQQQQLCKYRDRCTIVGLWRPPRGARRKVLDLFGGYADRVAVRHALIDWCIDARTIHL